MKKYIIIIVILALSLLAWWFYAKRNDNKQTLSFKDCVYNGYPVMESYPRQCITPDGRIFAEEIQTPISYVNSSANDIEVTLPFPGAVTGKEFRVIGQARGYWFFEASFSIELIDENGQPVASGIAQAQGEWMTREFVPFIAEISVPQSFIGNATLILRKDNPSGLPENDASISFPITVEY